MKDLEPLNSRQAKEIHQACERQWGARLPEGILFRNERGKVFLSSQGIAGISLDGLRVDAIGLYAADVSGELRLSIEGSQLIGPSASRNVIDITADEANDWLMGSDLVREGGLETIQGYAIVRCGADYLGSGKCAGGRIHNFVPKARRLSAVHSTHSSGTDDTSSG